MGVCKKEVLRALGEAVQSHLSSARDPGLITGACVSDGKLVIDVKEDGTTYHMDVSVECQGGEGACGDGCQEDDNAMPSQTEDASGPESEEPGTPESN